LKLLYLGPDAGTCALRKKALERLGHEVFQIDLAEAIPSHALVKAWAFKTGGLGFEDVITRFVMARVEGRTFDAVFCDSGELVPPALLKELRKIAPKSLVFNQDNPFVSRDGGRWRLFLKSLPLYDLYVTPRLSNVAPAEKLGARRVYRTWFSADEIIHAPQVLTDDDRERLGSRVAFVGTWMPERGPFMRTLVERGVPLTIFGGRWDKAPEYGQLKSHVRLGNLDTAQYTKAIAACDIALALLSKGNEDLHTTRSLEIPAIGTLLCGERTSEHLELYKEGEEAVFWDTADECAEVCLDLLANPDRIRAIAAAGAARARRNKVYNEPVLKTMLEHLMSA